MKKGKKGLIYIIRNDVNDKVYIGQTEQKSANVRFSQHKREAKVGHSSAKLYRAMREIGIEHFYVETLQSGIDPLALDTIERLYVAKYNAYFSGYNTTPGGAIGRSLINFEDGQIRIATEDRPTLNAIAYAVVDAFYDTDLFDN